jgi:hypothetical protein
MCIDMSIDIWTLLDKTRELGSGCSNQKSIEALLDVSAELDDSLNDAS